MTRKHFLSLGLILAFSVILTSLKMPLASSQGVTLVASFVPDELPVSDPSSDLWQKSPAVEVPLSAQNIARPMLLEAKVKSITARALHNGSQIAILVEWTDDTKNDTMVRVQDFRDAVALQFPLVEGQPFFCMGQQGGNVNIWHWKADWQADIAARQDMESLYPNMYVDLYPFTNPTAGLFAGPADYTDPNYLPALVSENLFASVTHASPVEDLVAGGFSSLTAQPAAGQNVQGYGMWTDGKWRVIFSRDLTSPEAEDVSFTSGKVYSVAFAVWDGANGERNGQKSVSQWISLSLESARPVVTPMSAQATPFPVMPVLLTLLVVGALVGIVLLLANRRSRA